MKENKKKIIILVGVLLVIAIGTTFAYFATRSMLTGSGTTTEGTTVSLGDTTVNIEGSLDFNDLNIYPGHKTVSRIKVTATGDKNVLYNLIWKGSNTIHTPLKYKVYKTTNEQNPSIICEKKQEGNLTTIFYETCTESNFTNLGEVISEGSIPSLLETSTINLVKNESIQATSTGATIYYYVVLEYENKETNQNIDMNGSFNGEVTIELIEQELYCSSYNKNTVLGTLTVQDCEPGLKLYLNDEYKEKYEKINSDRASKWVIHYSYNDDKKVYDVYKSSPNLGNVYTFIDYEGNDFFLDGARFYASYWLLDSNISIYFLGEAIWNEETATCTYNGVEVYNIITGDEIIHKEDCLKVYQIDYLFSEDYVSGQLVKVGEVKGYDESGIYSSEDDDGTSYYYRGDNPNNWVQFGKHAENIEDRYLGYKSETSPLYDFISWKTLEECQNSSSYNKRCTLISSAGKDMYWRIIRINGDGSIRLIYNGPTTDQTGASISMYSYLGGGGYTTGFNGYGDNAYVGYMYGTHGSSTFEETHANINSSDIKLDIDTWYVENLKENYEKYIDINAGFCGDRTVNNYNSSYTGNGTGVTKTYYATYNRLVLNKPTYKCNQINDLYTVGASTKGNKALTYPIGLITMDEAIYAGAFRITTSQDYWLNTGQDYWTMSPYRFSDRAEVYAIGGNNLLASYTNTNRANFARPVINLRADLNFIGSGTTSDPYRIAD